MKSLKRKKDTNGEQERVKRVKASNSQVSAGRRTSPQEQSASSSSHAPSNGQTVKSGGRKSRNDGVSINKAASKEKPAASTTGLRVQATRRINSVASGSGADAVNDESAPMDGIAATKDNTTTPAQEASNFRGDSDSTALENNLNPETKDDVQPVAESSTALRPQPQPRPRIRKLVAPRPFPTVPTSVSATGPRSAHSEGKNFICVSRRVKLGAYMRRCKEVIIKDGYKTLHLSAMGAAIPHLLQLAVALPPILPFAPAEIRTEATTGTVEVQDELIPDDEDEDITYQTRRKSTLKIVIKIGEGDLERHPSVGEGHDGEGADVEGGKKKKRKRKKGRGRCCNDAIDDVPMKLVYEEPEQEDMHDT